MTSAPRHLATRFARDADDLLAAQRLRYSIFVEELGGDGSLVDHQERLERDRFDEVVDSLILTDSSRPAGDHVVGVYRLLSGTKAQEFGRFYCDDEYDLTPLRNSGRKLLELGRSCVHRDYRGGPAMFLLWSALGEYVLSNEIELLFGVASFHGIDPAPLAQPLSWLHHHHLSPPDLRARAVDTGFQRMDLIQPEALDRRAAMQAMPTLIKAYLRLGGTVGEGAFIDRDFNTTDVFLLMDTIAMSTKHRDYYTSRSRG